MTTKGTAKLVNRTRGTVVSERTKVARSLYARTKGLLGRKSFELGEGLVILSCSSVHMFFMRFPIDVVFCSSGNVVLAIQENLRPWRLSRIVRGASYVVELPVGAVSLANLQVGDQLELC